MNDLVNHRLRPIREAEEMFRVARDDSRATRERYGTLAQAYDIACQRRARGLTEPDWTPDDETLGRTASQAIENVGDDEQSARDALIWAIRGTLTHLTVGDKITSPHSAQCLLVAVISTTDQTDCEVTLTADGGFVRRAQHSWPLDEHGKAITDGTVPVVYERWTTRGLRVRGHIHPESRRLLDTV